MKNLHHRAIAAYLVIMPWIVNGFNKWPIPRHLKTVAGSLTTTTGDVVSVKITGTYLKAAYGSSHSTWCVKRDEKIQFNINGFPAAEQDKIVCNAVGQNTELVLTGGDPPSVALDEMYCIAAKSAKLKCEYNGEQFEIRTKASPVQDVRPMSTQPLTWTGLRTMDNGEVLEVVLKGTEVKAGAQQFANAFDEGTVGASCKYKGETCPGSLFCDAPDRRFDNGTLKLTAKKGTAGRQGGGMFVLFPGDSRLICRGTKGELKGVTVEVAALALPPPTFIDLPSTDGAPNDSLPPHAP